MIKINRKQGVVKSLKYMIIKITKNTKINHVILETIIKHFFIKAPVNLGRCSRECMDTD